MRKPTISMVAALMFATSVQGGDAEMNFGEDVAFLTRHVETIVLGDSTLGPRIAVVPAYQGRVMTSTAAGDLGQSYGWLNYEHIVSGKVVPHINVYGGEERFWLGPEGGQFAIYFPPGGEFTLADWQTPAPIDTETYQVVGRNPRVVRFEHAAQLTNYSGTKFEITIDRAVRLLSDEQVETALGIKLGDTRVVGYETDNRVTNRGPAWQPETGLLSIWILGMYKPGPGTTIVIPYRQGDVGELGPIVNADYFGPIPGDRLKIGEKCIYFRGDGGHRGKIGLNARRSTPRCGSFDASRMVLTCVEYNQPQAPEAELRYVNSQWKIQDDPYSGDVINAYNDGPPAPDKPPLGPFYELETSSPARVLETGQTVRHVQRTFHFEGTRAELDPLAQQLFGVSLERIESAIRPQ